MFLVRCINGLHNVMDVIFVSGGDILLLSGRVLWVEFIETQKVDDAMLWIVMEVCTLC